MAEFDRKAVTYNQKNEQFGMLFVVVFVVGAVSLAAYVLLNPIELPSFLRSISISDSKKLSRTELKNVVKTASRFYEVPPELILAVIEVESGFNPLAQSHRGAMGLMQLMPTTAREMNVGNPFDPVQNVYGGTRYLGELLKRYNGNHSLALAAYNAGPSRVSKHRGVPPYRETRHYIKRVMALYQQNKSLMS